MISKLAEVLDELCGGAEVPIRSAMLATVGVAGAGELLRDTAGAAVMVVLATPAELLPRGAPERPAAESPPQGASGRLPSWLLFSPNDAVASDGAAKVFIIDAIDSIYLYQLRNPTTLKIDLPLPDIWRILFRTYGKLTNKKFIEKNALAYSVAFVSSYQIDKNNILNSTFEAMHKSIEGLNIEPDFILVDGNLFKPYRDFKFKCIIKGDQKYQNIAAASILAKTYRDEYMSNLHIKFPEYNWIKNKGYGTKDHQNALNAHGVTKYHRKSFSPIRKILSLSAD